LICHKLRMRQAAGLQASAKGSKIYQNMRSCRLTHFLRMSIRCGCSAYPPQPVVVSNALTTFSNSGLPVPAGGRTTPLFDYPSPPLLSPVRIPSLAMQKSFTVGSNTFLLDQDKAEAAFAAKRIINGRETMTFNLLPLKYQWAYDLYRTMKANHWEPEDIPMGKDIEQWRDERSVTDQERWIIRMGIGYFSAAEGIVGDNIQHVTRELVTAPELKLVLGRHAHEENIHADSLLYMISSLGINPHECEAMFEDIPTIVNKNEFVVNNSRALRRDIDLTQPESKRAFAKNIFLFGQCME